MTIFFLSHDKSLFFKRILMSTYFGFIPSTDLNQQINNTIDLIQSRSEESYYPHQLNITKKISHEIIENLFASLVDIIKDPKRKDKMRKLVAAINSSVDTVISHIITEQPNEKILDAFNFLLNDCLFDDNEGNRRIGFIMDDSDATMIINNFTKARSTEQPHELLQEAMDSIITVNLDHFLTKFSKFLNLGIIKRKTVPIAYTAINKSSQIAIHKLLPEMEHDACMRLINHFEAFLVTK